MFLAFARIAAGALRFDHGDHFARRVVEAIVGDAVPRRGIVAVHRHLAQHSGVIVKVPAGLPQARIDENVTRLCLVKLERIGGVGIGQKNSLQQLIVFHFFLPFDWPGEMIPQRVLIVRSLHKVVLALGYA